MKRSLLLVSVFGILFLSSCKHSTDASGGGGYRGSFSATVDGTAWVSMIDAHGTVHGIPDFSGASDSTLIDLQISPNVPYGDTGVHVFGDSLIGMSYWIASREYDALPKSGTAHLTKYTADSVFVTFNFTGKDSNGDSVVVTNGKINFVY